MTKRPSLERILWRSACRWKESYDKAPDVGKNLMMKRPPSERILWRSARRQKESISCTRLLHTRLADSISCSWIESGWHRLDVNLTRLASDLWLGMPKVRLYGTFISGLRQHYGVLGFDQLRDNKHKKSFGIAPIPYQPTTPTIPVF